MMTRCWADDLTGAYDIILVFAIGILSKKFAILLGKRQFSEAEKFRVGPIFLW
jgi:hypothetical protein